jgi:cysteine desulfurase family protein
LGVEAGRLVYEAREALATLFGAADPLRVIFTKNVTEALNLALYGLLHAGDHVIAGGMEHNAVIRPLRDLERNGVRLTLAPCSPQGEMDAADFERAIRPATRLIVLNHASNVVGTLAPIGEVGAIARRHGLLFLVDTAQTAGAYPIDMEAGQIDLLGFTGHKGLLGPQGTGGLVIGERVPLHALPPLARGGTGSASQSEEQPEFLPDKYEAGTLNAVGLAGLGAATRFVLETGVDAIRQHELALTRRLLEGLSDIAGVTVYGTGRAEAQVATVAFNVAGLSPTDVGQRLDEEFGVCCRAGLHCAPAAHRVIGTFPAGSVRFGLGYFNTTQDVDAAVEAVRAIVRGI